MHMPKRNLLAAMLLASSVFSVAALADETTTEAAPGGTVAETQAPEAVIDPVARFNLMQDMRARMREMMQTQDADKRKELMQAQMNDMDTLMEMGPPGMGMGMMMGRGMGPGPMAIGPGAKGNCRMKQGPGMGMMGRGANCPRAEGLDQRLDALEKRVDLMQTMLQHLMGN